MKTFLLLAIPSLLLRLEMDAQAVVAYFLVAEIPEQVIFHDSYVVPLTRPDDILYARKLIREGWHNKAFIVIARIEPGVDPVNRNYLAPGQPPWSWHVSKFEGFSEAIPIVLDGTPTQVEQNLEQRMAEGGLIGFAGYTIVAEVGPEPLAL